MRGKIIKGIAGFYYVYAEDNVTYACKARGIFRKDGQKPLVGDDVIFTVTDTKDLEGSIDQILPRKNQLIRPAVANVDQALIIFAVKDPEPNFLTLDRFLVMMGQQKIPVTISFSKTDLVSEEEVKKLRSIYDLTGYSVLCTSIEKEQGLEEVRRFLAGKTTVAAGPSGVGKSSLTNYLSGDVRMETGDISRKLKRGKQTTRHAEVIPIGPDTFLVDTPGFTSLYLPEFEPEELRLYYEEFAPLEKRCRFGPCMHISEPDCAVRQAAEEGSISAERYSNYRELYEELRNRKPVYRKKDKE